MGICLVPGHGATVHELAICLFQVPCIVPEYGTSPQKVVGAGRRVKQRRMSPAYGEMVSGA